MSVNMSNKEYNFLIMSETTIWQFFFALLTSKTLQSSWIHSASSLSKGLSEGGKENKIFAFVKYRTFHPTQAPRVEIFFIFRAALSFS